MIILHVRTCHAKAYASVQDIVIVNEKMNILDITDRTSYGNYILMYVKEKHKKKSLFITK